MHNQQNTVVTDNRPYWNKWTNQTEEQTVKFVIVDGELRPLIPGFHGRYYVTVNGELRQVDPHTGEFIG